MVLPWACLLALAGLAASDSGITTVSVILEDVVQDGMRETVFSVDASPGVARAVATGSFQNRLLSIGWGILNIETSSTYTDDDQAFAAGMAEGFLTAHHIYAAQQNLYPTVFGKNVTGRDQVRPEVVEFMDRQEAWTRVMTKKHRGTDPFWEHVSFVVAQFDGLIAGYGTAARRGIVPPLHRFTFTMLNGVGDMFDIIPAVNRDQRIDWLSLPWDKAERMHTKQGHCSGLIKLPGDFSDLFMGHSSWFDYSNTNRIFKHYHLEFSHSSTAARRVSFSSYPGFLQSLDDFYLLDSGLGWIQTTNTVLDHSVYDVVKPESLLAWQRVRVASAMARTGREWYEFMRRHFSGTYANQYMVVDFKLFKPMAPIRPGLLWVVEEMPGLMVGGDRTEELSRGYWPSYNIPYWPEVYNKSGYSAMATKHGKYYAYETCPRANIFRRDQGTVVDMETFRLLMRYNNFRSDPYSVDPTGKPNPSYAICSRGDLHWTNASANGCYDSKVTSFNFGATRLRAQAINGPPRSRKNGDLPPFTWYDRRFTGDMHAGLPQRYVFDFVDVEPSPALPAPAASPWTVLYG